MGHRPKTPTSGRLTKCHRNFFESPRVATISAQLRRWEFRHLEKRAAKCAEKTGIPSSSYRFLGPKWVSCIAKTHRRQLLPASRKNEPQNAPGQQESPQVAIDLWGQNGPSSKRFGKTGRKRARSSYRFLGPTWAVAQKIFL